MVTVEKLINAPATRVWQALTDKDEMKQWYFDIADFKAEPGFTFRFNGQNEGRTFVHICTIQEVIPQQKLSYSWRYENHPGNSLVTFHLEGRENQTLLRLTHEGLETFPAQPDFAEANFRMGWTELLTRLLPEYIEGKR